MFSEKKLTAEVAQLVRRGLLEGRTVQTWWLTNAVAARQLADREPIGGGDKEFYLISAWRHLREVAVRQVRQVLRRYKAEPEAKTDPQIVMPGFERLQRGYLVDREKESVLVPTDQLTDTELDAKANEYGRMAEGCRLHALELHRYRMQRAA